MQKIIQALLLTTLIAGLFCQKIVIDNSTLISPCATGARSAVDTYLITGTIGDNITMAVNQNWQTVVVIRKLKRTSSTNEIVCQFDIDTGTCDPYPAITCECLYNTTTDQARFTLSDTVQADDSNAIIHVQWQHATNKTIIYSNKNYTFPEIYDVNAAQLNLTVAGVTGNLPSGSCSFSLTLNKSNDLELCCSNTATPCYPQISFNGAVVANNTECVKYPTSQLASDGVTGNLDLSYSLCTKTGYRQGSSCSVIPKPVTDETTTESSSPSSNSTETDVTTTTTENSSPSSNITDESTTTTESSSSSLHSTVSPEPPDKCDVTCVVLVVVFVALFIIAVVIAVCCCKAKKCCCWANKTSQDLDVPSQGTDANAKNEHTSEHHKKDGQYSEHTNQAYGERRSSASDVTIKGVNTTKNGNSQQDNTNQQEDSNKQIKGVTNDGSTSQTGPRQLPPLKKTHTHGQLHPAAVESRPVSIEITSNKA